MSEGKPITDDESEELLRQYFLLVKEHNQFLKRNRRKIKKTIQKAIKARCENNNK